MNILKSAVASAALLAGGVVVSSPQTADAGIRFSIGNYGGGYGNYGGYGNRFGRGYGGYGNGFGYGQNYGYGAGFRQGYGGGFGRSGHHGGGHYDYHPTTLVPHGNHYDVIPGHYDYHQGGHGHFGH